MWTKPEQQTVSATARPLRVAYLVDLSDCPDALLDAIFAEAYGRWGGRRTLIVPTTVDGIDTRYSEWLLYFDADVIYSFVALNDESVAALHERYAPAHLVRHRDWRPNPAAERSFRVELPLTGLSSLSVLPVFVSRSWGFDGPPRNLKLLTKYWDQSESSFLLENFGFLSSSFTGAIGAAHLDLYSAFTLISDEALANPGFGKDARAIHVTSEDEVLEALGAAGGPLTLAQLSEFFAPFLDPGQGVGLGSTCIIIGDTPSDRLLFWNMHHLFERPFFSEITTLRVPAARAGDEAFLGRIREILRLRGARGYSGRNDHVSLHSSSLDRETLEEIAIRLRQGKKWLSVTVTLHTDHAAIVPQFRDAEFIGYRLGGAMSEPEARGSAEFHGKRVPVPLVYPWHMKEALPPAGLRSGNWMLDLSIDREVDHCRYINQRHVWRLPRRLRLERAFEYEQEGARGSDLDRKVIRIARPGLVSVAINVGVMRAAITTPDDFSALRAGICNDWEWIPFDCHREGAPHGRLRFADAEYSDKGRYLLGVLQLFESIPDSFSVLMDGYWRDVLHYLGAVPSETEQEKSDQFLRLLRKRFRQKKGPLHFASDDQLSRLAREALRAGRMIARETRYVSYGQLLKRWLQIVKSYIEAHPSTGKDDPDESVRDIRCLNSSVQYLCKHEVLFQGREWRCRSCYNRNWIGIDDLSRTLVCSVCGRHEPAPVSGSWQFRINPFILEAYRDHGTEAVIWALWRLSDRSRASFYFVPSLRLWISYPESIADACDAEVDAVAVVDGLVYLIEAKSSAGLDDSEITQLVIVAERIRPDVLLIACMAAGSPALNRAAEKLSAALPNEIKVEILTFNPAELDRRPFLPG